MSNALRWSLPVLVAVALVMVWNSLTARADDAPAAGATISGTVVDASGNAVAGANVRLLKAPPAAHTNQNVGQLDAGDKPKKEALQETKTDDKGAFKFDKVADGDYVVAANAKEVGYGRVKVSVVKGVNPDALKITIGKPQNTNK